MTYKTGTANSDAAKNIVDLIRADAVALGFNRVEAGLVEGTITWEVLESPSTLNNEGLTWYLALGYTTSGLGTLWACTFEQWNASTNLASNFPPNTANLTPGASFNNTQAAAALPSTGTTIFNRSATIALNDNYWYSITPERLAVAATVGATSTERMAWYVGLYDRFLSATDDPFPLVFANLFISGINLSGATVASSPSPSSASREPKTTTANTNNFLAGAVCHDTSSFQQVMPWTNAANNAIDNYSGALLTNAESYSGLPFVSRLLVVGRSLNSTTTTHLRGLFKDFYYCASPSASTPGTEIDFNFGGVNYTAVKMRNGTSSPSNIYMGKV